MNWSKLIFGDLKKNCNELWTLLKVKISNFPGIFSEKISSLEAWSSNYRKILIAKFLFLSDIKWNVYGLENFKDILTFMNPLT